MHTKQEDIRNRDHKGNTQGSVDMERERGRADSDGLLVVGERGLALSDPVRTHCGVGVNRQYLTVFREYPKDNLL